MDKQKDDSLEQDSIQKKDFHQYTDLAAALLKANQALAHQYKEKEKRAAELLVINQELAFQIREKEKRAAELEVAINELESFSYSVSHDLRAPLRAINGFTQVLLEDFIEQIDEEAKDILNEIISNSKKMGQLIDNLLDFSRVGKQFISSAMVDVPSLVETVITELRQLNPNSSVEIKTNPLHHIQGDRHMLKQVFDNLLSNAIKYSGKKENAQIEIGSYEQGDAVVYYVKDNGAGFDMKYYDKLYGVFQRLHSSNEFDGTGVGLAIVQKIINKHGGVTWAEGKVNEGATFYFSLPKLPLN
jgi:light-regulated signal transduction histidine kinase (bacteriophytochrome)